MNKGAISTIIATVLIVLITVASVTILWASLSPLLAKVAFAEDANLRITIHKQGGYTFYDKDNGYLSVRIGRGNDEADLMALKFVIDTYGESQVIKKYNVLGTNQVKLYKFGVGFPEQIDSLKVVPVYGIGGEERDSSYFAFDDKIPVRSVVIDNWDDVSCSLDEGSLSDGLVMYYSFEDTTFEDTIFDYSCNGRNGVVPVVAGNDAGYVDDPVRGRVFAFDGTGDYVKFAGAEELGAEMTGNKTIAFWANLSCKAGNSMVFGSLTNYLNFFNVCGLSSMRFMDGTIPFFSFALTDSDGWHYYMLIIKKGSSNTLASLYIDNILKVDDMLIGSVENDNDFYLGTSALNPDLNSFNGSIDEFRIYNRTLTETEIGELYTASGGT